MRDYIARMTSKGQITIPKDIRENIQADPGDYVIFHMQGNKIELAKAQVTPSSEFDKLSSQVQRKFDKNKTSKTDVEKAIKWSRK